MSLRGLGICVVVGALAVALTSGSALGQQGTEAQQEAVRLFEQSVGEYRAGRFQAAVDLLRRAYELQPDPILLYNLGRALEGLGDEAGAIDGYSRFLRAQPDTPDRGALEQRLETLRRRLAERQALAEERQRQEQEEEERQREEEERDRQRRAAEQAASGPGALPWVIVAAGGAALAGGGVLGLLAAKGADDADLEPTQREVWARYDDARSMATAANVCFVAGGVVAAVGLTWGIVGSLTGGRTEPGEDVDESQAGSPRISWAPPTGVLLSW